jgi:RHS repeat-associated protein
VNNNRVVGHSFDNAGNTTIDAEGRTFFYDAENKQKEVRNAQNQIIGQYLFDGDGKRVKKIAANDTTIFVYDAGGKLASEYLITASQSQAPQTSYLTNDTLGSPRVTTDSGGNVVSRRDFRPYGEEIYRPNQGTDKVRQKFTSYERDNETNLDYAKARMFGSGLGRFTSPDPLLSSGRIENPKTWNRYVYVLNNPTHFVDPTGLYEYADGTSDADKKRLDNAYKKLVEARDKFKEGSKKYNAINKSIVALGKPGEKNGVLVYVNNTQKNPGETSGTPVLGSDDKATGKASVAIGINLSKFSDNDDGNNSLVGAFGHEGSHAADYQSESLKVEGLGYDERTAMSASGKIMSKAISEVNAYRVSSYIAEAILPSDKQNSSFNGYDVWNRSWSAADENTKRDAGIRGVLESPGGSYRFNYRPNSIPISIPGINNSISNAKQWTINGGPLF